jgi:hypothetical protein
VAVAILEEEEQEVLEEAMEGELVEQVATGQEEVVLVAVEQMFVG